MERGPGLRHGPLGSRDRRFGRVGVGFGRVDTRKRFVDNADDPLLFGERRDVYLNALNLGLID